MYIIKNITDEAITIDGVSINSGESLEIQQPSQEMLNAKFSGKVSVTSSDTTLAERQSDTKAINDGISNMDRILN